ncbi:hypothetical protein AAG570_010182 [Ranatra chinensis]|uniref:folate gamma-glutamyl hydrolase n=1 Tax=Ranatra chinensis TaxID=642074 RepID=A0ABD0YLU6_9HEMI
MLKTALIVCFVVINLPIQNEATESPIIGILVQETSPYINGKFPNHNAYLAASYVKYVESSGARVVPIFINQTKSYYRKIIQSINGVLLPGGNTWFSNKDGYADAGDIIYKLIKEENENGNTYPILGICLGFELLIYLDASKTDIRTNCSSVDKALNLHLQENYNDSKIFKSAPKELIRILEKENVTYNSHRYCITEENVKKNKLDKFWRVVAWNMDNSKAVEFVSILESVKYPFLGLQFHPEKNIFEWNKKKNVPHSANAILVGRYFSDWLVKEARRNQNRFITKTLEKSALIYNYQPFHTGLKGIAFDQMYFFKI